MAAAALSIVFVAAGSAMASTSGHSVTNSHSVSGYEHLDGAVYGRAALGQNPTLPLQLRGLVRTHANFTLPSGNGAATIPTPKGTLHAIQVGKATTSATANSHCYLVFDQSFAVKVTGGTGVFWHASGRGQAHLQFTGYVPRYTSGSHKGRCNENANPTTSKGASATLNVVVNPLTIIVHRN